MLELPQSARIMVRFALPQRYFQRDFQRQFQRYTQPYPSSHVAVWKTGQGRDNIFEFTKSITKISSPEKKTLSLFFNI